jgi:hypothetical protein
MAASDTLSDKAVKAALKAAQASGKARKLSDGAGLVLEARPNWGWLVATALLARRARGDAEPGHLP